METTFWAKSSGSSELFIHIILGMFIGLAGLFALTKVPPQLRGKIVGFVTFISGAFYIVEFVYPKPINRQPGDIPLNIVEKGGFLILDSMPTVVSFTQIIAGMLIGLGIFSLLKIHVTRISKGHKDAFFSGVLLASMVLMAVVGIWDDQMRQGPKAAFYDIRENWTMVQYTKDFLFQAMLQEMDATMFSIIAFYILSAAYRAFRVRSVEATILLATALIVILSILGFTAKVLNSPFPDDGFASNFKITSIADWIRFTFQTPSINGIKLGVGIGAVAMSLRIWLNLEKTGEK